jgi:hypothetical protein
MEPISLPELKNSTVTQPNSSETFEKARRDLVGKHLRRMFVSAHQPVPEPDRMTLLIEDAVRLWRDIPSERLTEAVEAAQKEAGGFPATAGLVARCYERRQAPKTLELAAPDTATGVRVLMDEFDSRWEAMTQEERDAEMALRERVCRDARAKIGGAA